MHIKVAGLRRLVQRMDGISGDTTIDLTRLNERLSTIVHDPEDGMYIDVRFDLEDLADEQ
jgi:hypothetical protein